MIGGNLGPAHTHSLPLGNSGRHHHTTHSVFRVPKGVASGGPFPFPGTPGQHSTRGLGLLYQRIQSRKDPELTNMLHKTLLPFLIPH